MAESRNVDPDAWQAFLDSRPPLAVGATAAYPGMFPEGLGISPRNTPRNQYLGLVETRHDATKYVLGFNYNDAADDGDNENICTIDVNTRELKLYMRGTFEREYPEYAGYHRAKKGLPPEEAVERLAQRPVEASPSRPAAVVGAAHRAEQHSRAERRSVGVRRTSTGRAGGAAPT